MLALFIGDIVGRQGRECVGRLVPALRAQYGLHLVVANGENAAGGFGITPQIADEILASGVDAITLGNHTWAQSEIIPYLLNTNAPVIRPLNFPPGTPGRGVVTVRASNGVRVTIMNVLGRLFMEPLESPFRSVTEALIAVPRGTPVIVDVHAEATSEKMALGYHLDGRVSAVLGTHTHVPTADVRVLPKGTLYVTDVGMVGPRDSIIGADKESMLQRFLTQMPVRSAKRDRFDGPVSFSSVLLEIDEATGKGISIRRLDIVDPAGSR